MELIESLRFTLRKKILLDAAIVPPTHFQMEGKDAPGNVDLYVRETIIQSDVTELMQNTLRYQYICEYDAFVDRTELPDVTGQLYRIAGMFRREFPAGSPIVLDGASDIQCFVASPVVTNAVTQDGDLFELPIILNVEIITDRSAVYNGN